MILDRYHDDIFLIHDDFSIVCGIRGPANSETTTVKPDHDSFLPFASLRLGPDVQSEAILAEHIPGLKQEFKNIVPCSGEVFACEVGCSACTPNCAYRTGKSLVYSKISKFVIVG